MIKMVKESLNRNHGEKRSPSSDNNVLISAQGLRAK